MKPIAMCSMVLCGLLMCLSGNAATVTVNTASDVQDALPSLMIPALIAAPGADGVISLREAIVAANNTPGNDIVDFAGDYTIVLTLDMAAISDVTGSTTIDGSGHTIVIDGNGQAWSGPTIATIYGAHSIKNISLANCVNGITITLSGSCVIQGCRIGLDGGNVKGVYITTGASGTLLGGTGTGQGNIISNNEVGVLVDNNVTNVEIKGNLIGTDASGTASQPNTVAGILLSKGAQGTAIGGTAAGAGNVISGNVSGVPGSPSSGIVIDRQGGANPSGNTIVGNLIGLDASGAAPLPNDYGVAVTNGATNNTVGGVATSAGNAIAYNAVGVLVSGASTSGVAIKRNAIYGNDDSAPATADGIRLESGANGGIAAPVIAAVSPAVTGTAPANATVEIFADSGSQGRLFVESVPANGAGVFTGATDISVAPYEGLNITATATDGSGNTSEFSAAAAGVMVNPTVTGITLQDPSPTNVAQVRFAVNFSEAVTGIEAGVGIASDDFALTTGTKAIGSASIAEVSGNGASYVVTATVSGGAGTLRLDVLSGGGIQDGAGNGLLEDYTSGPAYAVDQEGPGVAVALAYGTPTNLPEVDFTVTFSETVTGIETGLGITSDDFAVLTGSKAVSGAAITAVSGSGASYTVSVSTGTGDGTLGLSVLAGGGIADSLGNVLAADYVSGAQYTIAHLRITEDLPATVSAVVGENVQLEIGAAGGSSTLHYQWYFESAEKAAVEVGGDADTLTLLNVQLTAAGAYSVEVTDAVETVTSSSALLQVSPKVPVAGLAGLGALAGLVAASGAFMRRKNR